MLERICIALSSTIKKTLTGSCLQAECWRSGYGWQSDGKFDPCRFWSGDIRCYLAFWRDSEDGYKLYKGFSTYPQAGKVMQVSWPLFFCVHHSPVVGFSVLQAAEVLKIGFSPDKLLAFTKYCKVFEDLWSTCFFRVVISIIIYICIT